MKKNKESIVLIEKQLSLVVNKNKKIIDVAKYLGTSRKTVSEWIKTYR